MTSVVHLDELPEVVDDQSHFRPVRLSLGITAFGATVWTASAADDPIVNEHDPGDPSADQELFVVLRGHATFELDGESVDAPAGTFVHARPGVRRSAFAKEARTEILLIEGTPGKAYEARGWELWAPLAPQYAAGEYDRVAEELRTAIAAHPEYALLFYNLACCESLTGKAADALDHLRRAIKLSDEFREAARHDTDLDAIREEPSFRELIGS